MQTVGTKELKDRLTYYLRLVRQGTNLSGGHVQIGRQQSLRTEFVLGIPNQHPADGHGWHAGVVPHGCRRHNFHSSLRLPLPARHNRCSPSRARVLQNLLQGGQPFAFQARASSLTGRSLWRGIVKSGVQAQAGDHGDRLRHVAQGIEQGEDGKTTIGHDHQLAL